MEKFMIRFSFIISILSFIGMTYIAFMVYKGTTSEYETKKISEQNIITYIENWDRKALASSATKEYRDYVESIKFDKEYNFSKDLGTLVRYYSGHPVSYMKNDGSTQHVIVESQAEFKNGIAGIKAMMIQVDGKWKISNIEIFKKSKLDLIQRF